MKTVLLIVLLAAMSLRNGSAADELEASPAPKTGYVVVQGSRTEKPVVLEYKPDLTLMTALGSVEMFSMSSIKNVRLIRDGKVIICNCKRLRAHPEEDFKLVPGDVVQVPDTFF